MQRARNFKDRVGMRFGRLTAIAFAGIKTTVTPNVKHLNNKSVWLCRCDCGVEKEYIAGSLAAKRTRSCGCLSRETTAAFNKKIKTKVSYCTFSAVWQSYKKGALDRNYEFSLSKDDFLSLTQGNCYYCGIEPKQERKSRNADKLNSFFYNGIDRIDNNIGYVLNNCVSCCKHCNRMKRDQSIEAFSSRIKILYERQRLWATAP